MLRKSLKTLAKIRSRDVLPSLFAILTQHDRYIPEPEWASTSMVHNLFRVYEQVFGRRRGIRAESGTAHYTDENGRVITRREFYTFEALCVFVEQEVVAVLRHWKRALRAPQIVAVHIPVFAGGIGFTGTPYLFAIAFDGSGATAGTTNTSPPSTFSVTTSGSLRCIVSYAGLGSGNFASDYTSMTCSYNSVSMTHQVTQTCGARSSRMYALAAPTVGANNVSFSWSGGNPEQRFYATSYTGVDQTTPVEATAGANNTGNGSTMDVGITTLSANAWMVIAISVREGGVGNISLSGGNDRFSQDQSHMMSDKAATTATSYTLTWNVTAGALSLANNTPSTVVALKEGAGSSLPLPVILRQAVKRASFY